MKMLMWLIALCAASFAVSAKDCEAVKAEVDTKIKANGVANYTLEILDTAVATDGKVVGTCDGGVKKVVYKRGIDRVRR
ncbi:MAG TPA: DUF1161 domain-containing protein [Steroidobacteraceae bacterium]|nr:DUF1161 domain-containing protein [Steroidobacteraceae bacterium]